MTSMRRTNRRNLTRGTVLGVLLLLISACGSGETKDPVRPLVDLEGVDLSVGDYDDPSLQERLERLEKETAPIAAKAGGWGRLTTDLLNPEIQDIVFTGADRATLNFGYGTEATSMLARNNEAIFVVAGDSGSCWGIRFRGDTSKPEVRKNVKFAPNCYANELADLAESSWTTKWPAPAEPTGGTAGAPPSGPTGRNGAGVPEDTGNPESTENPGNGNAEPGSGG